MKRYFIVFFSMPDGIGDTVMETTEGRYLNRAITVELIREKVKVNIDDIIVITNIIELSKYDYDFYNKEYERD